MHLLVMSVTPAQRRGTQAHASHSLWRALEGESQDSRDEHEERQDA